MAAAVVSRAISSGDLICRASSMTCWPSRMSMPCALAARTDVGTSTMSMPTGMPATPVSARMPLISATALVTQPGFGRGGAAHGGVRRDAVLGLEPGAVHPVVHRRRPEVPQEQLAGAGVERVPAELVPGPLADRDTGQVPDVVVVEDQQGAKVAGLQGGHGAAEPVLAETGEVHPLLEVDVHAPGGGRQRQGGNRGDGRNHECSPPSHTDRMYSMIKRMYSMAVKGVAWRAPGRPLQHGRVQHDGCAMTSQERR